MSITPYLPDQIRQGNVFTWVNSQWKFIRLPGQFSTEINTRSLPAAELALLSLAEVLLGPFWVWLFLGETASANTLVGGLILLVAIAGNALSGKRRKPPPIIAP